uniref:Uncharacterized protein n=1 Tax=Schistocephalus solidus TaxID=70667 RepID=A0A0V0J744_SCHSO
MFIISTPLDYVNPKSLWHMMKQTGMRAKIIVTINALYHRITERVVPNSHRSQPSKEVVTFHLSCSSTPLSKFFEKPYMVLMLSLHAIAGCPISTTLAISAC